MAVVVRAAWSQVTVVWLPKLLPSTISVMSPVPTTAPGGDKEAIWGVTEKMTGMGMGRGGLMGIGFTGMGAAPGADSVAAVFAPFFFAIVFFRAATATSLRNR